MDKPCIKCGASSLMHLYPNEPVESFACGSTRAHGAPMLKFQSKQCLRSRVRRLEESKREYIERCIRDFNSFIKKEEGRWDG